MRLLVKIREFLIESFGFGDPCIGVLRYFYSRKDELVSSMALKCLFGDSAYSCVSELLEKGYIAGEPAPGGADVYFNDAGKLIVKARPNLQASPYRITVRGVAHLKELRRNTWAFVVTTLLAFAALLRFW